MNIKPKRLILIFTIVFILLISTNIVSSNELDQTNETITTQNTDIITVDEKTPFEGKELYVNHEVETSGDGSAELPFATIKEAIDVANTGTNPVTIHIHPGEYNETNMTITNSLVLKSYNGTVTLNANKNGWFLYSNNSNNNLSLHGLIFKNGVKYDYYDSTVGGVVSTEGHIDVVNCTFENNFGGTGGGINSHNGANIINSTFKDNKAEYNGAAAYVIYGQTNIVNSTFTNNTAKRQGGALRIQGDTYVEHSIFTDNYAGTGNYAGNGGAIRVTDGNLAIESSIFKNNSAKFEGGAVSAGDDSQYSTVHYSLNINNSTFTENKARSGAAIIANDGINMTNSVLSNNSVPYSISARYGQGSGIYVLNGNTILVGNTISNNTNPYNKAAATVFSYQGNVAEKDNNWGEDSKINTNHGKTTNEVTQQPTITRPVIIIENGQTAYNNDDGQGTSANPENGTDSNNANTSDNAETNPNEENTQNNNTNPNENVNNQTQSDIMENNTETENNNMINEIIHEITNAANTIKNKVLPENNVASDNTKKIKNTVIATNSTTELPTTTDIGDKSENENENSQNGAQSAHELSAREVSPIKSVIENEYAVPAIIIILILTIAFIIGFLRKREDD